MFTCIACTKTDDKDEEGGARESGTPSTKEAVKSLTTQVLHLSLSLSLSSFTHNLCFSIFFFHLGEN